MRRAIVVGLSLLAAAVQLHAGDLDVSGFALVRGQTAHDSPPLTGERGEAQVQLGIDWNPTLAFGTHVHLLARTSDDASQRGHAGVVEAFVQQTLVRGDHRLHFMEGAFFLPTSHENVDALWESPYNIASSALNSWMGEEFRPIGVDAAYTLRHTWQLGATLFEGNDTFGALPADRGWTLNDHWALLGEHQRVDPEYFTSVSAETDHRLGWSARGKWMNDHASLQLTHIDNRADAMSHGDLLNWETRFDIAGADYTWGDWNAAAESGWGTTSVIFFGTTYPTTIRASYLLVSRRFANGRATLRGDAYDVNDKRKHAITATYFFSPPGTRFRAGVEAIRAGAQNRVAVELRYTFDVAK